MQDNLLCKLINNKISLNDYLKNINKKNNYEFILYTDNILEGITLLNLISENQNFFKFYAVIYEPIDQPIYVFKENDKFISIKICGNFSNWNLPNQVKKLISFIDLPDYLIYSISNNRILFAGETTETVSVGNSQWQREGRKVGAAKIKVPFIYQTFYSGRDESLNKIREPSSLQAYNHLLYSIKYKVPSFVIYLENNYQNSKTRKRNQNSIIDKFVEYIKILLLTSIDNKYLKNKISIEEHLYLHMCSFLLEKKYYSSKGLSKETRLLIELPSIDKNLYKVILDSPDLLSKELANYINNNDNFYKYGENFCNINVKLFKWRNTGLFLKNFIEKLNKNDLYSPINRSRIGFANSEVCAKILKEQFPVHGNVIDKIFFNSKDCIIFPLRLHKGKENLIFSPDPESGEITAFCELFSKDINNKKIRPVIGFCTVKTPKNFELHSKKGTKLYKAIANYIDCVVINGDTFISNFENASANNGNYLPKNIVNEKKKEITEEIAIISTFLQLGSIKSNWDLCFIHTHHSSWQQLILYKNNIISKKIKINRNQEKVDLVMQKNNIYFIGEGKKQYRSFFSTKEEVNKISSGIKNILKEIKKNYHKSKEVCAFICVVEIPEVNSEFFLESTINEIKESIKIGHLDKIVTKNYLVIIVYEINKKTFFKLLFSEIFNAYDQQDLNKIFPGKLN